MRVLLLIWMIAFAVSFAHGENDLRASVDDLGWMTGSWAGPFGEQTLEANWIRPEGGTIASLVRFTGENGTGMIELIIIEEVEDSLVLRVRQWFPGFVPRAPEPQTMILAEVGERRVGFASNGSGDFRTLTYSRPAPDVFNIDVETRDGDRFQLNRRPQ